MTQSAKLMLGILAGTLVVGGVAFYAGARDKNPRRFRGTRKIEFYRGKGSRFDVDIPA